MTKTIKRKSSLPEALGRSIKARRAELGWTQAQLAEAVKVEVQTISRIERGSATPSLLKLEELAYAMGVPLSALLSASSSLPEDQMLELAARLRKLPEGDRFFIVGLIHQLCGFCEDRRVGR